MHIKAIIALTILAASLGCDQPKNTGITQVEIYYRSFDSLSPISHSKSDLVRAAPFKLSINDAAPIHDFLEILPSRCNHLQEPSEDKIDYYLLARMFSGERLDSEFGSSGLQFVDGEKFPGKVCQLSPRDREGIDAWLQEKVRAEAGSGN